jgi:hypothetical protein
MKTFLPPGRNVRGVTQGFLCETLRPQRICGTMPTQQHTISAATTYSLYDGRSMGFFSIPFK